MILWFIFRTWCNTYSNNVFQVWEDGDETYHQELMVPALLIYGAQDKFVTLEEEQWMQEVCV